MSYSGYSGGYSAESSVPYSNAGSSDDAGGSGSDDIRRQWLEYKAAIQARKDARREEVESRRHTHSKKTGVKEVTETHVVSTSGKYALADLYRISGTADSAKVFFIVDDEVKTVSVKGDKAPEVIRSIRWRHKKWTEAASVVKYIVLDIHVDDLLPFWASEYPNVPYACIPDGRSSSVSSFSSGGGPSVTYTTEESIDSGLSSPITKCPAPYYLRHPNNSVSSSDHIDEVVDKLQGIVPRELSYGSDGLPRIFHATHGWGGGLSQSSIVSQDGSLDLSPPSNDQSASDISDKEDVLRRFGWHYTNPEHGLGYARHLQDFVTMVRREMLEVMQKKHEFVDVAFLCSHSVWCLRTQECLLYVELKKLGLSVLPVIWTAKFDYTRAGCAVIRTLEDYWYQPNRFLSKLKEIEKQTVVINHPDTIRWGLDKSRYLQDLDKAGIPIVPTTNLPKGSKVDLNKLLKEHGYKVAVLKPRVGSFGSSVAKVVYGEHAAAMNEEINQVLEIRDMLFQPLAKEVTTKGEYAFLFIDGEFSNSKIKMPTDGIFIVNTSLVVSDYKPTLSEIAEAKRALDAIPTPRPVWARVDMIVYNGSLSVSELECFDPQFYWSHNYPTRARKCAEAIQRHYIARKGENESGGKKKGKKAASKKGGKKRGKKSSKSSKSGGDGGSSKKSTKSSKGGGGKSVKKSAKKSAKKASEGGKRGKSGSSKKGGKKSSKRSKR